MLIFCKHLDHEIYSKIDKITKFVLGDSYIETDIVMGAIPIKYKSDYWLVANLAGLEISAVEFNKQSYEIKYASDLDTNGSLNIRSICEIHEIDDTTNIEYTDCFYDEHLKIMFIRFQNIPKEYVDLETKTFISITSTELLKKIPIVKNKIPDVINSTNLNEFSDDDSVCSADTIDTITTQIHDIKIIDNHEDFENSQNLPDCKIYKQLDKENILFSIYSIEKIKSNISIAWINKRLSKECILVPSGNVVFDDKFINFPPIPYINLNVESHLPICGSIILHDNNFIGMGSFLNDGILSCIPSDLIIKSFMKIYEKTLYNFYSFDFDLIQTQINLKNAIGQNFICEGLSYKKNPKSKNINIILELDEYKIECGNLLIDNYKIPVLSYLWLCKTIPNIKIKSISSNLLKDVKYTECESTIYIDLTNISNIKFGHYNIKLTENYKGMTLMKLNFIKYKEKTIVEVNEKIMQILKNAIQTTDKFDELYDSVYKNKFSLRTMICLDTRFNIKLVSLKKNSNIISVETLLKSMSKSNLKKFIKSI